MKRGEREAVPKHQYVVDPFTQLATNRLVKISHPVVPPAGTSGGEMRSNEIIIFERKQSGTLF